MRVASFSSHPSLPPEWRPLIVTGFLGGLMTFSTLSAEVVSAGRMMWVPASIAVQVAGSIAMTLLGIGTVALLRSTQLAGG